MEKERKEGRTKVEVSMIWCNSNVRRFFFPRASFSLLQGKVKLKADVC